MRAPSQNDSDGAAAHLVKYLARNGAGSLLFARVGAERNRHGALMALAAKVLADISTRLPVTIEPNELAES